MTVVSDDDGDDEKDDDDDKDRFTDGPLCAIDAGNICEEIVQVIKEMPLFWPIASVAFGHSARLARLRRTHWNV